METATAIETQQAEWLEHQGAGAGNARFLMDDKLIINFTIEPWLNQRQSNKEQRPVFEDREYVEIRIPGNSSNIVKRPVTTLDRVRFKDRYENWKKTGENKHEGTPLSAWPKITVSQAKELEYFGVRTIEQLADLNDSATQQFRNAVTLKKLARDYLDAVDGRRVSDLEDQIKEMQAKLDLVSEPKPARKRATLPNSKPAG